MVCHAPPLFVPGSILFSQYWSGAHASTYTCTYNYKQVQPSVVLTMLRTEPCHKWRGSVFVFCDIATHYAVLEGLLSHFKPVSYSS